MTTKTRPTVTIDAQELQRLQACEKAWSACFMVLLAKNNDAFQLPLTGTACAVREIKRLQVCAGLRPSLLD